MFPCLASNHLITSFISTLVQGKEGPREQRKYSNHRTCSLLRINKIGVLIVAFFQLSMTNSPTAHRIKPLKDLYKLDSGSFTVSSAPTKLQPFGHNQLLSFLNPSIHFHSSRLCTCYLYPLPSPHSTLLHLTNSHSWLKAHSSVTFLVKRPKEPQVEILIPPFASTVLYIFLFKYLPQDHNYLLAYTFLLSDVNNQGQEPDLIHKSGISRV